MDDADAAAVAAAIAAAEEDEASAPQPSNDDIMEQERDIRGEAGAVPLVGPQVPLDGLREQYADNPGFLPKVENLGARYSSMRRTRPDGNCFYRGYLFGIFEKVLADKGLHEALLARARASLEYCLAAGYERIAVEDFHEDFCASLERLGVEGADLGTIMDILEENDGYLVFWMRILTSSFLKRNADDYAPFLETHPSIERFCATEVDPVGVDADHLQITALSAQLQVPVCVVYLDQSAGDEASEHMFASTTESGSPPDAVHLLYRPGHYDLIYA